VRWVSLSLNFFLCWIEIYYAYYLAFLSVTCAPVAFIYHFGSVLRNVEAPAAALHCLRNHYRHLLANEKRISRLARESAPWGIFKSPSQVRLDFSLLQGNCVSPVSPPQTDLSGVVRKASQSYSADDAIKQFWTQFTMVLHFERSDERSAISDTTNGCDKVTSRQTQACRSILGSRNRQVIAHLTQDIGLRGGGCQLPCFDIHIFIIYRK